MIYTDRLHVAIGALSWGKMVKIYTGSYLKIRDIYDSSMVNIKNFKLKCWDADKRMRMMKIQAGMEAID
jgi:hypothetical protein